jgi:serine phosphatase RsbU (regulator of sigma subunit)
VPERNERTRLSRALNDLDRRIHSRRSSDEVLQTTLDAFVETLGADAGDIKLIDGDDWVVRYVCGFGPDVVGLRLTKANAPVAARVAAEREPVTIADYLAEPESFYVGFPRIHALRATLAMPLFVGDEVVGCLFAWMREAPRTFTDAEVDFARRVAASAALALENARLFEAERAARSRAETAEAGLARELETTQILLRASEELTSAPDVDELLERLASIVLDATGMTRVFINLIDMKERVLTPKIPRGALKAPMGERIPLDRLSQSARDAIAGKVPVVLDYERPGVPEADRAIAEANNARVVLFVPLVHLDEVIGHISLDEPGTRHEFTDEQMRVVGSIAAHASVALEHARLYERGRRIAETLQHAMLAPLESTPELEFAWWYEPASAGANVGGDFYDLFEIGDGRVALVIGDVAGKGLAAAQLTMLVRDGIRSYLLEDAEPARVLARVNALAYRFTAPEVFATAFVGILDVASGQLSYGDAGHPPPVVMDGDAVRELDISAGLLGAFEAIDACTLETTLPVGGTLCLFTDGATDARRGTATFGCEGVLEALGRLRDTPVARLPHALLAEIVAWSDARLADDIAIVCVARRSAGEAGEASD